MSALKDLCHEWIGRGRPMSPEQVAGEANVSMRTAQRWADMTEDNEPDLQAVRNMLSSTILPADFRLALAQYLFQRSIDLRVTHAAPANGEPHAHPLRLTYDVASVLCELQKGLDAALSPLGEGGATITARERLGVDRDLAELLRRAEELRRAVAAKCAKLTA